MTRWVDVLEVDAGEVLVREERGDFWFFVILSGQVRCTRRGHEIRLLGPGDHFGEEAIVGLRPQRATATTTQKTVLLVLGAQYLLSVLVDCPRFQQAVFPEVPAREYRAHAKRMHELGRAEWREIGVRLRRQVAGAPDQKAALSALLAHPSAGGPDPGHRDRVPGRPLSLREAAARFVELPAGLLDGPGPTAPAAAVPRWLPSGAAAALTVAVAAILLAYHPPRAVVTAGRPVDVVGDIDVTGRPAAPVHGRYLLLWVQARRPALGRYLLAVASGRRTVSVDDVRTTRAEQAAARDEGRRQYLDSQRTAVSVAEGLAGVDGRRLSIHIRDRGFVGPSAGLVYALALNDLLSGRNCAAGRVVAATGSLDADGAVGAVGWVEVKMQAARHARAAVAVVAAGEEDDARMAAAPVVGVTDVRQAVDSLCRGSAAGHR